MNTILESAQKLASKIIAIRRELHEYPEASCQEFKTSARVKEALDALGIAYKSVTETGVVGVITGGKPGKTIALRADMDALEMEELADVPFKSKNKGLMHACGHDGHTASLLGAAEILNNMKSELCGKIILIFQPAEERLSGASAMLQADPFFHEVDHVFGIHYDPTHRLGEVSVGEGILTTIGVGFQIKITGVQTHGSSPQVGIDASLPAATILTSLQSVVAMEVDPAQMLVLSIGRIHSGTRMNIISGQSELEGTIRCYDESIKEHVMSAITRFATHIAKAYRAEAEVLFPAYVPVIYNDPYAAKILEGAATKIVGKEKILPIKRVSGSDDIAFFLKEKPGCYTMIGSGEEDKGYEYAFHHPKYLLNEKALIIGSALMAQYTLDFLNAHVSL